MATCRHFPRLELISIIILLLLFITYFSIPPGSKDPGG